MANPYQPGPYYSAFPPTAYYPPHAHLQHSQPQPPMGHPSVPPQGMQSMSASPYLNSSRFGSNAQTPNPNIVPRFPAAPFTPDLMRQFSASNLAHPPPPLPQFPPMPILAASFPPFAQNTFAAQYANGGQYQNNAAVGGLPQHQTHSNQQAPLEVQQSSGEDLSVDSSTGEIDNGSEEGELSDGEIEGSMPMSANQSSRTISQEDQIVQPSLPGQKGQISPSDRRHLSPYRMPGQHVEPAEGKPAERHGSASPRPALSDGGSVSSYNPPSASTPNSQESSTKPLNVAESLLKPGRIVSESPPVLQGAIYQGKSASQMRDLAKGALLSLAPHNIRYADVLKEGIDASVLSQLYTELGIKGIWETTQASGVAHVQPPESVGKVSAKVPVAFLTEVEQNSIHDSGYREIVSRHGTHTTLTSGASTAIVLPKEALQQPPSELEGRQKGTVVTSQIGPSPLLERKDRIAQLLAAKTGKVMSNRNTPETPSPTLPSKSAALEASLQTAKPVPALTPAMENPDGANSPLVGVHDRKPAKSKAQTDLVRQKMESLKREAMAKAQVQTQAQNPSSSDPAVNGSRVDGSLDVHRTILHSDPRANDNNQSPSTFSVPAALSCASPALAPVQTELSFASLIPGLFMTSAESEAALRQSDEKKQSIIDNLSPSEHIPTDSDVSQPAAIDATGLDEMQVAQPDTSRSSSKDLDLERSRLKRPLPANFSDESAIPPAKRVLDAVKALERSEETINGIASDDVSDGEVMEIDDERQNDSLLTVINPPLSSPPTGLASSRTDPPTSSLQVNESSASMPLLSPVKPTSAASNTPKDSAAENLWSVKNQEIEAMRRRIAEMEERQKAKRSQSQVRSPRSSGPSTPVVTKSTFGRDPLSSPVVGATVLTTSEDNGAGQKASENSFPAAHPNPAPTDPLVAKAAALKAEVLRQRLLRKKVKQDGLPDLDTENQNTQIRLAEIQAQLAQSRLEAEKREAEVRAARQREQEILAEVARLQHQLQQGLVGRKQLSQELFDVDGDSAKDIDSKGEQSVLKEAQQTEVQERSQASAPTATDVSSPQPIETMVTAIEEPLATSDPAAEADSTTREVLPASEAHHLLETAPISRHSSDSVSRETSAPSYMADDRIPSSFGVVPLNTPGNQTCLDPEFTKADLEQLAADHNTHNPHFSYSTHDPRESSLGVLAGQIQARSPCPDDDSDGSVSMSDSGSEDYQPAEPDTLPMLTVNEDSDEYEPKDITAEERQPVTDTDMSSNDHLRTESVEQDVAASHDIVKSHTDENAALASGGALTHNDDREEGLQITEANILINPPQMATSTGDALTIADEADPAVSTPRFVPYRSPLDSLKSFRFHPSFNERAREGYRSLTFSNHINPNQPLCPTELAGAICSDSSCEEQHFKSMTVPDAKILEQLASAQGIEDKSLRDEFLFGLKQVIASLREEGVKEFSGVAERLAAYRRRFRQQTDPALLTPSP